ncbi:MAG: FAD-dependent oxidoreductase, partial [Planctomycetaceae bacterium]|nr:FAD-dependent oxidoreductase [Planctomycetaceae bacterium]
LELRETCGLSTHVGQTRPLHMVVVRGNLPWLNGHCVDGAKTRVTITSEHTTHGKIVWQLGGQIAELGVDQKRESLLSFAADELRAAIPGIDLTNTEWSSYRIDRAEPVTPDGKRPDHAFYLHEQNIWTAWPTKLALAPQLAEHLLKELIPILGIPQSLPDNETLSDWFPPKVARYPWETEANWIAYADLIRSQQRRAA